MTEINRELGKVAQLDGGYQESSSDNFVRHYTYGRSCQDCKMSWSSIKPEDVDRSWWEHVRDTHPTSFAVFLQTGLVPEEILAKA